MGTEDMQEAYSNMEEALEAFMRPGPQDAKDVVYNYDTCRHHMDVIMTDPEYRSSPFYGAMERGKPAIIKAFSDNFDSILSAVYEAIREGIAEAKTLPERSHVIANNKLLLEIMERYPEHSQNKALRKVVAAIEAYESKLDDEIQAEDETSSPSRWKGLNTQLPRNRSNTCLILARSLANCMA
jgi:hypothetical protein